MWPYFAAGFAILMGIAVMVAGLDVLPVPNVYYIWLLLGVGVIGVVALLVVIYRTTEPAGLYLQSTILTNSISSQHIHQYHTHVEVVFCYMDTIRSLDGHRYGVVIICDNLTDTSVHIKVDEVT